MIQVELPGGSTIEFPDGTSQETMQAAAAQAAQQESFRSTAKQDPWAENLAASFGGAFKGLGLGAQQLGSLASGGAIGAPAPSAVQEWKQAMSGLWSTPMGKLGTVLGGVAASVPAAMVAGPSVPAAAAVGAGFGALQPTEGADSRLLNTAIGGGMGALGQAAGNALTNAISKRATAQAAQLAQEKATNAVRDAALAQGQKAGYVVPPNMANPESAGVLDKIFESIAGKASTAQQASVLNQDAVKAAARADLGLPENTPITPQLLADVRKIAGTAYEQVKGFGPIQALGDKQYATDLGALSQEYKSLVGSFPSQKIPAVDSLLSDLNRPQFSSDAAVELVKRLRFDGFKNVRSPDAEKAALGRIQLGAQDALENLIDRNLAASGNPGMVDVLRNARQMIAQTYSVQGALKGGNIVAGKLSPKATGELGTARTMAENFPKAMQNPGTIGSNIGLSPLDAVMSLITGSVGGAAAGPPGIAAGLAWPVARMGARSAVLSGPWQRSLLQSYEPGLTSRVLQTAAESPWLGLLGRSAVPMLTQRYIPQQ